jgi:hypothetical protein
MTLTEIETARASGSVIQADIACMKSGHLYKHPPGVSTSELSRYEQIKTELTCTADDTVLLISNRIVIPAQLQERTVDIAHEGHLSIVKTKALMREKVWFPLMDKLIEQKSHHIYRVGSLHQYPTENH